MIASVRLAFVILIISCSPCFAQSKALDVVAVKATIIRSAISHLYGIGSGDYIGAQIHYKSITNLYKVFARPTNKLSILHLLKISGEPWENINVLLSTSSLSTVNRKSTETFLESNEPPQISGGNSALPIFSIKLDTHGESLVYLDQLFTASDLTSSLGKNITIIISY